MKPSFPARVFLVEDHPRVRQQLAALLERDGRFSVCGVAEDAKSALSQIVQISPDLVLLDLSLKNSNGFEVLAHLQFLQPDLPVLVLSIHETAMCAAQSIRAGARGYLSKQEAVYQLVDVMQTLLAGQTYPGEGIQAGATTYPSTLAI